MAVITGLCPTLYPNWCMFDILYLGAVLRHNCRYPSASGLRQSFGLTSHHGMLMLHASQLVFTWWQCLKSLSKDDVADSSEPGMLAWFPDSYSWKFHPFLQAPCIHHRHTKCMVQVSTGLYLIHQVHHDFCNVSLLDLYITKYLYNISFHTRDKMYQALLILIVGRGWEQG